MSGVRPKPNPSSEVRRLPDYSKGQVFIGTSPSGAPRAYAVNLDDGISVPEIAVRPELAPKGTYVWREQGRLQSGDVRSFLKKFGEDQAAPGEILSAEWAVRQFLADATGNQNRGSGFQSSPANAVEVQLAKEVVKWCEEVAPSILRLAGSLESLYLKVTKPDPARP